MEEDRQSTYASTQFETVQCGMLTKLESQDNVIPLAGKKSSNLTDTAPNCSLLPVCYNSSPTNLRCCKDRSFFDNRVEFQIVPYCPFATTRPRRISDVVKIVLSLIIGSNFKLFPIARLLQLVPDESQML